MDEDEEEFYDSLDEEHTVDQTHPNEPIESELISLPLQYDVPNAQVRFTEVVVKKEQRMNTKIPLYVGETDKEDIKLLKKNYLSVPATQKCSSVCVSCETAFKPKVKIDNPMKKKAESSYWNLYCQKNRLPSDDKNSDTLKSFYGSTKTFSSLLNSSSCLTGSTWDAPSVFEKYMPKRYATQKSDHPTYDEEDIERSSLTTTRLTSVDVDVDNLKSASQSSLLQKTSKSSKVSKSKSNTSNASFRPLSLKCAGPDCEKLQLLRKQQEYGTRASSRNRARIIQNLTKLKQELHHERKGVSQ